MSKFSRWWNRQTECGFSLRLRLCLVMGVWVAAISAIVIPHPPGNADEFCVSVILFPVGLDVGLERLFAVAHEPDLGNSGHSNPGLGIFVCLIIWSVYIAISVGILSTRKRLYQLVAYGCLCLFLAVNAAGCNEILSGKWTQ
jgi:hypothetical protein